jgi:hypothetical protein
MAKVRKKCIKETGEKAPAATKDYRRRRSRQDDLRRLNFEIRKQDQSPYFNLY